MATLTIRNIDDELKANLRVRAARHGQSMEEEVRCILRHVLGKPVPAPALGQRLAKRFQNLSADLPIPPRSLPRTPPNWDDVA